MPLAEKSSAEKKILENTAHIKSHAKIKTKSQTKKTFHDFQKQKVKQRKLFTTLYEREIVFARRFMRFI